MERTIDQRAGISSARLPHYCAEISSPPSVHTAAKAKQSNPAPPKSIGVKPRHRKRQIMATRLRWKSKPRTEQPQCRRAPTTKRRGKREGETKPQEQRTTKPQPAESAAAKRGGGVRKHKFERSSRENPGKWPEFVAETAGGMPASWETHGGGGGTRERRSRAESHRKPQIPVKPTRNRSVEKPKRNTNAHTHSIVVRDRNSIQANQKRRKRR